jgi:hypothetical protein
MTYEFTKYEDIWGWEFAVTLQTSVPNEEKQNHDRNSRIVSQMIQRNSSPWSLHDDDDDVVEVCGLECRQSCALFLTKQCALPTYGASAVTIWVHTFLNLVTGWRWAVSFTPRPF